METVRGNFISIHFDSMVDFEIDQYAKRSNINYKHFMETLEQSNDYYKKSSWKGPTIKSTRDALEKSIIGDHELYQNYLVPRISELDRLIGSNNISDNTNTVPVVRRKRKRAIFGDELDIQYVLRGQLDKAFSASERIVFDQEHSLITILIANHANCSTDARDSLWTAAACLKVVDDLQKAGKNVQIIIGGVGTQVTLSGMNMSITFCVKKYNEHLSVERLAAMTHLGFYRTICFLGKLTSTHECEQSLGYPVHFNKNNLPIPLQDEITAGKTKIVIMNTSLNIQDAYKNVVGAFKQINENATNNT